MPTKLEIEAVATIEKALGPLRRLDSEIKALYQDFTKGITVPNLTGNILTDAGAIGTLTAQFNAITEAEAEASKSLKGFIQTREQLRKAISTAAKETGADVIFKEQEKAARAAEAAQAKAAQAAATTQAAEDARVAALRSSSRRVQTDLRRAAVLGPEVTQARGLTAFTAQLERVAATRQMLQTAAQVELGQMRISTSVPTTAGQAATAMTRLSEVIGQINARLGPFAANAAIGEKALAGLGAMAGFSAKQVQKMQADLLAEQKEAAALAQSVVFVGQTAPRAVPGFAGLKLGKAQITEMAAAAGALRKEVEATNRVQISDIFARFKATPLPTDTAGRAAALQSLTAEFQAALGRVQAAGTVLSSGEQAILRLGQAAGLTASEVKELGKHFDTASQKGMGWFGRVGNMIGYLLVFTTAMAVFGAVVGAIGAVGRAVLSMNSQLEQAQVAFTTLLGSATAASDKLAELQDFARRTPFRFPDVLQGARVLTAFGFEAEAIVPVMTAAGNAVSAFGGSTEVFNRVLYSLGQVQTRGFAMGTEIRELAMAGIPVWAMLAEQMHKPVSELRAMSEAGQITANDFLGAFQAFSQAHYGDMMAKQSQTFAGAMSNIQDSLELSVARGFKPFFEVMRDATVVLANFLMSDQFKRIVDQTEMITRAFVNMGRSIHESMVGQLYQPQVPKWISREVMSSILGPQLGPAIDEFVRLGSAAEQAQVPVSNLWTTSTSGAEASAAAAARVTWEIEQMGERASYTQRRIAALEEAQRQAYDPTRYQTTQASRAASDIQDRLSKAREALQEFKSAPIAGESEMSLAVAATDARIAGLQAEQAQMRLDRLNRRRMPTSPRRRVARELQIAQLERTVQGGPLAQYELQRRQVEAIYQAEAMTYQQKLEGAKAQKGIITDLENQLAVQDKIVRRLQDEAAWRDAIKAGVNVPYPGQGTEDISGYVAERQRIEAGNAELAGQRELLRRQEEEQRIAKQRVDYEEAVKKGYLPRHPLGEMGEATEAGQGWPSVAPPPDYIPGPHDVGQGYASGGVIYWPTQTFEVAVNVNVAGAESGGPGLRADLVEAVTTGLEILGRRLVANGWAAPPNLPGNH